MQFINESYPNIGYVLNRLSEIADTKCIARKGNSRYRKEEDLSSRKTVDPALIGESVRHLFYEPISKIVSVDFAIFFTDSIWMGLNNYLELIKRVPMEGVAQDKVAFMLNRYFVIETLASIVWKVGTSQMPNNNVPSFYCEKYPFRELVAFYESQNLLSENKINRFFSDNIRTVNKWRCGEEIPNLGNLTRLAQWASVSNPSAINEDKETLFLTRFIDSFHRKTNHKFVNELKEAVIVRLQNNQEPLLDLGQIFSKFYFDEISSTNLFKLTVKGSELHKLLKRTSFKPTGSFEQYSKQLKALDKSVEKHNLSDELRYHSEWLQGRLFILSGRVNEAIQHYINAVELSLYKSGDNIRNLLKESLAVAAIQQKPHKPTMKKIKSRALTFCPQIIDPHLRKLPVCIATEDIDDWRLWFALRFPKSGWFDEGVDALTTHLESLGLLDIANKVG
jgi:hypothetical protein|tara:strand:+ start:10764 stop:12110 length:1347 start_codon:yes stop_codon:yes gene_type:complete